MKLRIIVRCFDMRWFLSRRARLIVARHEVPGSAVLTFPKTLGWVESGLWPEGPGELSPGFTLGKHPNMRNPEAFDALSLAHARGASAFPDVVPRRLISERPFRASLIYQKPRYIALLSVDRAILSRLLSMAFDPAHNLLTPQERSGLARSDLDNAPFHRSKCFALARRE
jgi:hypothetical protein